MFNLEINDLDKKIWDEELSDFVPEKVYDVHTHIYQWQSNLDKNKNTGPYKYQGENFQNVSFGMAWSNINANNHSLKLDHCDSRMTFIRYEQLRAMKRGARQIGLSQKQREALFYNTAKNLVKIVKSKK